MSSNSETSYYRVITDRKNQKAYIGKKPTGDPDEHIVEVEYKQGTYEYAVVYGISGWITSIQHHESREYGNRLNIFLEDNGENFCLQLKSDNDKSSFLWHFLPKINLINYKKPVRFSLFWPEDADRPRLLVQQKNEEGKWKHISGHSFAKEQVPDWDIVRNSKGEFITADKSEALEFYLKQVARINEQLKNTQPEKVEQEEESDLPW